MDFSNARVEKKEPLMIEDAKWITLVKNTFVGPDKQTRTWESMERLTRSKNANVDAVGIVAILQTATGPEILLQKQFRPPIDKVCIEIPAGLIDEGETAEACAIRELKVRVLHLAPSSDGMPPMIVSHDSGESYADTGQEETGYVGKVILQSGLGVSPVMFNDPGVCNTNLNMVRLSIDMTVPENQDPKPELEEDEFIEAFSVRLVNLYAQCRSLEQQGFAIDARVGTIAEGIELAKLWNVS